MARFNKILVLGTTYLALASAPVFAQWYGGISAGVTSTNTFNAFTPIAGLSTVTSDDRDTGYKVQAGYQFTPNWGVEFGYVNLGKVNSVLSTTAPLQPGFARIDRKSDGWNAVAVGSIPLLNNFSLIGKLGTIYSTSKSSISYGGAVFGSSMDRNMSEWNWTYGLGVQYDINKKVAVKGEWERFDGLRAATNGYKLNYDFYSVGLSLKFQ